MEENKLLVKIKETVNDICSNNNTYENILLNLKKSFTHITDPTSPRKKEFNEKYATLNLSESTVEEGLTLDVGDNESVNFEFYLYKNNPKDIVVATILTKTIDKAIVPQSIELFIYEK